MKRKSTRTIQRRYTGKHRVKLSASTIGRIRERVERESERYNVSMSFVIANALAFAFGIPVEDTYK